MTAAEDSLRAGDLTAALAQLQADIRQRPADPALRVFLAQLLVVLGQWDRASTQLTVVGELDALALPMVHLARTAIRCELFRREVFAGARSPLILGEPEPWIAQLVQALSLDAACRPADAADLRAMALEGAVAVPGSVDGRQFPWIADADTRLGPVLEVILNGSYYWVPLSRIQHLKLEAPEDLRDLVWMPAQFTWANGGEAVGLVPVRYPGTELESDDALRLSRKTVWVEPAPDVFHGFGQRLLATDADEFALLDVRDIEIAAPA